MKNPQIADEIFYILFLCLSVVGIIIVANSVVSGAYRLSHALITFALIAPYMICGVWGLVRRKRFSTMPFLVKFFIYLDAAITLLIAIGATSFVVYVSGGL